MKRLIILFLFIAVLPCFGQVISKKTPMGLPLGTKIIQVGFNKNDVINTSFVKKSKYVYLMYEGRWVEQADSFKITYGIPKDILTNKEGHTKLSLLKHTGINWHGEFWTKSTGYLFKANYFDYVFKVLAYKDGNVLRNSQLRYIRQKKK